MLKHKGQCKPACAGEPGSGKFFSEECQSCVEGLGFGKCYGCVTKCAKAKIAELKKKY